MFPNIAFPKENLNIFYWKNYSCTLLIACKTQVHLGVIGSWLEREHGIENRLLLLALNVKEKRLLCR